MDTRKLLADIAQTLREFAYTQQQWEEFYLLKLADTIDDALLDDAIDNVRKESEV